MDNQGNHVGSVRDFKMGDPEAATTDGQVVPNNGGISELLAPSVPSAKIPDEERDRLLRFGYVEIRRHGILHKSLYVFPDEIDRVEDDTVHLGIGGHERAN